MPKSHSALTLRIPPQCPVCHVTGRVKIETVLRADAVMLLWRRFNCDQHWPVPPEHPPDTSQAVRLPESSTGLYWSMRGHVACERHAAQLDEDEWSPEGWQVLPSTSQGFRGVRFYQCQYRSPDHTALVPRRAHEPSARASS